MQPFGVHWFRRDLRVAGNPGLQKNFHVHRGRVVGLFCFDSSFLARADFSHNRFAFFLKTLRALREELRELGSDLLVVDDLPADALLRLFAGEKPALLTFNRDYEPFARARDARVIQVLGDLQIPVETFRDHLVIEPQELSKGKPGEFYQIYSPFAKRWFQLLQEKEVQSRLKAFPAAPREKVFSLTWKEFKKLPYRDALDEFEKKNSLEVDIEIPEAGSAAAKKALHGFTKKLGEYKTDRDIPSLKGTSRLAMYLKNGSLTTAQIIAHLGLQKARYDRGDGPSRFLKELVWREFYYHILYHRPDVEKHAFLEKYRKIRWKNDRNLFAHWCAGTTGFPIVDAGMRELNSTGWMHNRVRMIVSSFLCKDLLIDWRWGEKYFMEKLLDGDLAANNGNWQWAASTGCDPQPYFRIFNPWLQSAKFDPEAEYIKRYIPELKDVPAGNIHKPSGDRGSKYPRPIVDHDTQKKHALVLYKSQNS